MEVRAIRPSHTPRGVHLGKSCHTAKFCGRARPSANERTNAALTGQSKALRTGAAHRANDVRPVKKIVVAPLGHRPSHATRLPRYKANWSLQGNGRGGAGRASGPKGAKGALARAPKARSALSSCPRVRPLHVRYTPRHPQKERKLAKFLLQID